MSMKVDIVEFPETAVAVIEHRGPPEREHDSVRILIEWKIEKGLLDPLKHRHYGVHYTDPRSIPPEKHRVDFCISVEGDVDGNRHGVVAKRIPACRCARARDIGSRNDNQAAAFLVEDWLPESGELPGDFPIFFHYVNVGPGVRAADMITDVYLPLR
jgi:AraC family transcriptional regulator